MVNIDWLVPAPLIKPLAVHLGLAMCFALGATVAQRKFGRGAVPWPIVGAGAVAVLMVICLDVADRSKETGAGALGSVAWLFTVGVGVPAATAGGMTLGWVLVRLARFSPALICVIEAGLYALFIVQSALHHW